MVTDAPGRRKARYFALLGSLGIQGDPTGSFGTVVSRYGEPHRRHHDLKHVEDCLDTLDSMRSLAEDALAIELAVWFHDIVYDPASRTNEQDSAALFLELLAPCGLDEGLCRKVVDLILSTRHVEVPQGIDAALLHDADMAILGSEPEAYDAYCRGIRQEYGMFSDADYRTGRLQFLGRTLGLETIFRTGIGRERFEAQARRNLGRETDMLTG